MATPNESAIPELHRKFLAALDQRLKAAREERPAGEDLTAEAREALLADFRERLDSLKERRQKALARFDEEIQRLESTLASLEKGSQGEPKPAAAPKEKEKKGPEKAAGKKKGR